MGLQPQTPACVPTFLPPPAHCDLSPSKTEPAPLFHSLAKVSPNPHPRVVVESDSRPQRPGRHRSTSPSSPGVNRCGISRQPLPQISYPPGTATFLVLSSHPKHSLGLCEPVPLARLPSKTLSPVPVSCDTCRRVALLSTRVR